MLYYASYEHLRKSCCQPYKVLKGTLRLHHLLAHLFQNPLVSCILPLMDRGVLFPKKAVLATLLTSLTGNLQDSKFTYIDGDSGYFPRVVKLFR